MSQSANQGAQQLKAIVVEYHIQNDVCEVVREQVGSVGLQRNQQPEYPNMYILPKKYESASQVKIADVIRSFPIRQGDSTNPLINPQIEQLQGKVGMGGAMDGVDKNALQYGNLHFRFETCLVSTHSKKKVLAYRDIVCNSGNLKDLEKVPVPIGNKDQIRIKVLKMPCLAANDETRRRGVVQKRLPPMDQKCLAQVYRGEIGYNVNSNFQKAGPQQQSDAGGKSGLIGMATGMIGSVIGGGASQQQQQQQQAPQQPMAPPPNVDHHPQRQQQPPQRPSQVQEGMAKINQAANNLKGMFDNLSTKVFQGTPTDKDQQLNSVASSQESPDQQRADPSYNYMKNKFGGEGAGFGGQHLNFSDDDDDLDQHNDKRTSPRKNIMEQQHNSANPNPSSQYEGPQLGLDGRYHDYTEKYENQFKADVNPQPTQPSQTQESANLLFGDSPPAQGEEIQQPAAQNNNGQTTTNLFDSDLFGGNSGGNSSQQPAPDMGGFGAGGLMDGLNDLNFNDFGAQPQAQETTENTQDMFQQQQQMPSQQPKSRSEAVKDFFQQEAKKRDDWDDSQQRLQSRIDDWIGVPGSSGNPNTMPGYLQPQKKHIKVLLCTLHTILWEGNNWQVIGMDKMSDPNTVKKFYRKAILMCHPDKVSVGNHNPDKVYIANRCYAALNDAFNEYKNEPGVNL